MRPSSTKAAVRRTQGYFQLCAGTRRSQGRAAGGGAEVGEEEGGGGGEEEGGGECAGGGGDRVEEGEQGDRRHGDVS